MKPLLSVRNIKKSFSGVVALSSVDLDILPAEVHALIGQNGAGKSTLIKILTGVYRRDSGEVSIEAKASSINSPRDAQDFGIATIYQELNLVGLRSVTENICMGYEPKRLGCFIDWPAAHRQAQEVLKRFGVDIDVREPLQSYSTAIQQLVAIARAVSLDAKLVIMDEPTSSLDEQEVEVLFGVIRGLKRDGVSVLYVSHFLEELYQVCDRVTIMRDGENVAVKEIATTSRIELIAQMLGREAADIESAGMTEFSAGETVTGDPLLEVSGIATGRQLKHLDMTVHSGEIVGLAGLLGSGRTEAARALFGLDRLQKGSIRWRGQNLKGLTPTEGIALGIGYLTEDRKSEGIVPGLSVRENLSLAILPSLTKGGRIDGVREREIVDHFVQALGIKTSDIDQPIRELSGGNQQKVLLARWLAIEPQLLLLDEPTRGVDIGAKSEIQAIIRDYVSKGVGVVLISSEYAELVEGADTIVVLQEGVSVSELANPGVTEDALLKAIAEPASSGAAA